jgi:hypothetical protein
MLWSDARQAQVLKSIAWTPPRGLTRLDDDLKTPSLSTPVCLLCPVSVANPPGSIGTNLAFIEGHVKNRASAQSHAQAAHVIL